MRIESIPDRVIKRAEQAEVRRNGKGVAQIKRKVGAGRKDLLARLNRIRFSKADVRELNQAMDAASDRFGYADRD